MCFLIDFFRNFNFIAYYYMQNIKKNIIAHNNITHINLKYQNNV